MTISDNVQTLLKCTIAEFECQWSESVTRWALWCKLCWLFKDLLCWANCPSYLCYDYGSLLLTKPALNS